MNKAFIAVVALLALCMALLSAAVGWQVYRVQKLTGSLNLLDEKHNSLQDRYLRLNTALEVMHQQHGERIRQQQEQLAATKAIHAHASARYLEIQELHNDAANLAWSATELPADIIRLHSHPTFTGSDHYREYLQHSGTVPVASEPPQAGR